MMKRGENKKGQVTIFIIIAVLIIAAIGIYLIVKSSTQSGNEKLPPEAAAIQQQVQDCLKTSLENTIETNGLQGGYYEVPENSMNYKFEDLNFNTILPYYFIEDQTFIPSEDQLKEQIALGIKSEMDFCLNLTNFNYDVDYSLYDSKVNIKMKDTLVEASMDFPIVVNLEDSKVVLNNFKETKQTSLLKMYKLSKQITEFQKNNTNSICLTCNNDLAKAYNFKILTNELEGEKDYVVVYYILDGEENNPKEIFSFAHKFSLD